MKKSYFWGLLIAVMALIPSQALADYCKVTSSHSHSERHLDAFTITDGANSLSLTNVQPNKGSSYWPSYSIYFDKTESQLITTPGATLYFSQMTYPGSWTHGYVYIDYNNDETFDQVANNDGTTGGELVSYSAYKPADATDDIYYDVNGNVVPAGAGVSINTIPSWTIPADLAEGTYRLRFKIDWNNIDPCGASDIATNGCGTIVDITLNVKKTTAERTISVTATPAEAGTVSVNGNGTTATAGGQITITAVPVSGYAFVNWTLNGVEVSTSTTFVDDTEGDKEYVANFAVDPKLDRSNWSIYTVSSAYQGLDGDKYVKGEQAIDNDPTSYWHSDWDNAANKTVPQWIVFDLGSVQKFTSFSYAARTAEARGANGAIKTYKLYVSETAPSLDNLTGSMTEVTSGEFIYPNATHMVELGSEYSAQYVMLYATATYGGTEPQDNQFANCADFFLYYEGTTPAPAPVYAVSVATADEAMGTAEVSATEVEEGEEVTFTATAAEGYQFVNWTSGEGVVSTENPYTVAVTAEMALTANFELIPVTKYTVTVNAGVGGTAEASATEVEEGQTVTLTATAAEGYVFANWTSSAESVYYIQNYNTSKYLGYNTANLAAIDNQTSDVTFTPSTMNEGEFTIYLTNATYNQETPAKQNSYMNCDSEGRFSGNAVNTDAAQQIAIFKVEDPTAATITATKVSEITSGATYMFVGLKSGAYYALTDELYEANNATKQRMVGAEVTITDGTLTFVPGTSSALWTIVNKAVASTENPYTVTVTSNIDMTANFVEVPVVKYPVSVTTVDGAMGTAEVSATEVKEGEEVTFTATANLGYKFIGWLANGETVSTENPYTTAVTAEMSLVANFEALTPAIIVTNDTTGVERQFTFDAFVEGAKIQIDWGNGELEEYDIAFYDSWTTWTTTITGTLKGEGVVKIYGDQIRSFDCGYASSYPVKVTSIDVSGCPNLYDLSCYTNSLTTIDLTNNSALSKLALNGNPELNNIVWPETNALTTVDLNDCAFTTLDLSACTSLTTLKVNNNTGMGSIDVSANTALTTLYANNIGLTTIDLSANTKLKNLYVNENQLTSLNISTLVAGSYTFANDNQLTELITAPEMLTSKTRINIKNNNFTLATLPAITGINAYNYAPQNAMTIATEITEVEELDLSSQAMVGENATVYTWYTAEGEEFTSYTVEGGKFVFNVEADTELYCTMTNASFDKFSGTNALATTNIVVKNFDPAIIVTNDTTGVERQFTFDAFVEGAKVQIDWGNGELEEYDIAFYDSWTTWTTTITGTLKGEGVVKIYGDQIRSFDCSYTASYPVKVTSLDLTGCPNLYELVCNSNQLTALDLSANTALVKLTANNSAFAEGIDLSANTALTTIDFNDAGLPSIDLSANTALTSVKLNNNALGSLDVSANTALTTLYANNTGLTTIDLSANVVLKNLYVNENQLTSLNISNMVAGSYTFANDNQLTELITAPEMLTSKTRINIKNNNFTLATLPAITGINAYNYAPQNAMTIATEITEGEELDLSSQAMVGENATVYTWYTAEGEEFTGYTVEGGKFVFDVEADTELYCTMTNASFDKFSGTNALATTNILVKYVAPTTCEVLVNIAPTEDYGTVVIEGVEGLHAVVEVGTEVTAVATPAEGKIFEGWFTFVGDELSTEATYTFTATEDVIVVAWFTDVEEPEVPMTEGGIELTFTKVSSTESTVAVVGTDVNVDGITASVTSNYAWKALNLETEQYFSASSILCPDKNSNAMVPGSEAEFTFVLNNVPAGYKFGNVTFTSVALNGGGAWQGDAAEESQVTFTLMDEAGESLAIVENKPIKIDSYRGGSLAVPFEVENYYYATDGTLTLKLKLAKGAVNNGCFYGLIKVQIETLMPTGVEEAEVVDAAQVYAANGSIYINGYEGNVKVVNTSGQVVKDVNVNGNDKLEMTAGLYMVVTGDQVTKVVVK